MPTLKDHQEKLKIKKRISFSTSPTPSYPKPLITYSSSSSSLSFVIGYLNADGSSLHSPLSCILDGQCMNLASAALSELRESQLDWWKGLRSIYWRLFGPCSIFVMQIIVYLHPLVCWRRIYIYFLTFILTVSPTHIILIGRSKGWLRLYKQKS